MKFVYQYRTSDNAKHSGVIAASDKDAAFALLRAQGIKAFCVEEAPGVLNKLLGKGKRWIAIVLLAVLAIVSVLLFTKTRTKLTSLNERLQTFDSGTRRWPIGDTAVIELGIRTGWSGTFTAEGDRFLASFAIPGVPAAKRSVQEELLRDVLSKETPPLAEDGIESRQMKCIVNQMKREIADLLSTGWTLREVGTALARRQDEEIGYYNRAQVELTTLQQSGASEGAVLELWQRRNDGLRRMGIRTLPYPEDAR